MLEFQTPKNHQGQQRVSNNPNKKRGADKPAPKPQGNVRFSLLSRQFVEKSPRFIRVRSSSLHSRHKAADRGAERAVCRPDQRSALHVWIVDDGFFWNIDPRGLDLEALARQII